MTRTLLRGAMAGGLWIAAAFSAQGETAIVNGNDQTMTLIPFAESSAELTFDAIGILSNIARDLRLVGTIGDVIYLDAETAPGPVLVMRLAQIKNLLIDLGVPSGQLVISAAPHHLKPFAAIRAASPPPPQLAKQRDAPVTDPNSAE